jgi:hypothetical protein
MSVAEHDPKAVRAASSLVIGFSNKGLDLRMNEDWPSCPINVRLRSLLQAFKVTDGLDIGQDARASENPKETQASNDYHPKIQRRCGT